MLYACSLLSMSLALGVVFQCRTWTLCCCHYSCLVPPLLRDFFSFPSQEQTARKLEGWRKRTEEEKQKKPQTQCFHLLISRTLPSSGQRKSVYPPEPCWPWKVQNLSVAAWRTDQNCWPTFLLSPGFSTLSVYRNSERKPCGPINRGLEQVAISSACYQSSLYCAVSREKIHPRKSQPFPWACSLNQSWVSFDSRLRSLCR